LSNPETWEPIADAARRVLLPIFLERCEARAILVAECAMNLRDAVDGLQEAAGAYGLIEAMGQEVVQEIMAEAFGGQI
jgi:hypothetical protein